MDMNYRGGMWEGGGGQDGVESGGKWDNCNSIINKYIFKNVIVAHSNCYVKRDQGIRQENTTLGE